MFSMKMVRDLYNIFLESLFPISSHERKLFSYTPEEAYSVLPKAPPVPIQNAISIFAYKDERVTKLIWNIKYKKSATAVAIGGYALYQKLLEFREERPLGLSGGRISRKIIILPIPVTLRRRRERGFNQTELLIEEIKLLDKNSKFIAINDLLVRRQHVSRQTLKGRAERLQSTQNIFSLDENVLKRIASEVSEVEKSAIMIIDDVITTGSTMQSAMETMKHGGFENVYGLSLAH